MSEIQETGSAFAELVEPRLPDVAALCLRLGIERLDLFGSAATGRFDPQRSDLDFFVIFGKLSSGRYAKTYFELRAGLEQLFGRTVDLLTEDSLANPYLRRQVESERRRLYPLG